MHATTLSRSAALFGAILFSCTFVNAQSLIYDHGPLITHPGGGAASADVSALDNSTQRHPAHSVYGFGAQRTLDRSLADEFTACGTWTVSDLEFFVYQTLAAPPTITGVYAQIWSGNPSAGGTVLWGNLTTNLLPSPPAGSLHGYRTLYDSFSSTDRPVARVRVPVQGLVLQPGVYWIEMQFTGAATSGPWVPPVTETGVYSTGHALQRLSSSWVTLSNSTASHAGVSIPFRVYGTTSQASQRPAQELFGVAKPATGQVPAWGLSTPVVGRETMVEIADGAPGATPLLLLGTRIPGVTLPPFGTLYVSPLASMLLPPFDPQRLSSWPLQLPHGPGVCGVELALQGIWADPGVAGGIAHTGGMVLRLGTFTDLSLADRVIEVEVGKQLTIKVDRQNPVSATVTVRNPTIVSATVVPTSSGYKLVVTGRSSGQTIVTVRMQGSGNAWVEVAFHVTVP